VNVYLVWQNDGLMGIYRSGAKAERRLLEIKGQEPGGDWPEGNWVRSAFSGSTKDPYIQRWWQRGGPIARLSIEKEKVE